MNTNVNLEAAVGVLVFLGTAFVMGLAVLVIIHAIKTRKRARAGKVGLAALAGLGLYLVLLLALSFMSREKVLAFGEEKHFCEIDCHLAYSVTNIRKTKTLGEPPDEATAQGIFYVVTIKTRFDETTISQTRGNAQLWPNSRVVTIMDEQGNSYSPSTEGQRLLNSSTQGSGTPLTEPLRPGEAYTTELVFDLPANIKNPELLMREGEFVTHFIIGHENSLWHKKTKFRLES
ncbi:MAG: hypothetical protein QOH63_37 [Acidobacteriota bacterium]|jgi:hypothetical protein|nr:hypothetical protein [Acidobacteriota bacterium]